MDRESKVAIKILKRLLKYREIDPVSECWNWKGSLARGGYGKINIRFKKNKTETILTHRYSIGIYKNIILFPDDIVHHKCHNRKCFNPDHLVVTGPKGNMDEKKKDWEEFCLLNKELITKWKEIITKWEEISLEVKSRYYQWNKKTN